MIDFELYSRAGNNYKYVQDEYTKLKELLDSFKSTENKSVKVFLQGSYKNDTNIGRESDIDIVIYYDNVFSSNINNRNDMQLINITDTISNDDVQRYNNYFKTASYSAIQFKTEVIQYLKVNSRYLITEGKKTIKC